MGCGITLGQFMYEIEENIFKEAVLNEWDKLCSLSFDELILSHSDFEYALALVTPYCLKRMGKDAFAKHIASCLMAQRFGSREFLDEGFDKDKIQWNGKYTRHHTSHLAHFWLKSQQHIEIVNAKHTFDMSDGSKMSLLPNEFQQITLDEIDHIMRIL